MNPKRQAIISHEIAILSSLLLNCFDEIGANSQSVSEIKELCEKLIPYCEKIQEECFGVTQIRQSTYLNDVAKKVETVIRKNYEQIIY
jgi:hypothetical protein